VLKQILEPQPPPPVACSRIRLRRAAVLPLIVSDIHSRVNRSLMIGALFESASSSHYGGPPPHPHPSQVAAADRPDPSRGETPSRIVRNTRQTPSPARARRRLNRLTNCLADIARPRAAARRASCRVFTSHHRSSLSRLRPAGTRQVLPQGQSSGAIRRLTFPAHPCAKPHHARFPNEVLTACCQAK